MILGLFSWPIAMALMTSSPTKTLKKYFKQFIFINSSEIK